MNKISISGNLTADPQLRFTPSGDAVVNFSIGHNERKFDKSTNQWVNGEPLFVKVEAWRQIAEGAAEKLHQGDAVLIVGSLRPDNWVKDGQERKGVKLVAEEISQSVRAKKTESQAVQEPAW